MNRVVSIRNAFKRLEQWMRVDRRVPSDRSRRAERFRDGPQHGVDGLHDKEPGWKPRAAGTAKNRADNPKRGDGGRGRSGTTQ